MGHSRRRAGLLEQIHIAYLMTDVGPGGLQNMVFNLAHRLEPTRFTCTIVSLSQLFPLTRRVETDRVKIMIFDKKPGNDLRLMYRLYRYLQHEKPHIVQTHNWGTLFEGFVAAKLAGVPVVIHAERGTIQGRKRNLLFQRALWKAVNQVLSVSEIHRQLLSATVGFPGEHIKPIANGVDTEIFQPRYDEKTAIRTKLGFEPGRFYIGTVGNLRPVKNHALLLRACRQLCLDQDDVRLIIAGTGPLKEQLSELAGLLGIQHKVRLLGARTDIPEVLNAMDLFVLPSLSEGMPNAVLEAMACGLPVVATQVGGVSEVVEHGVTGLLVPSEDEAALTSRLEELFLSETTRQMLGKNARERALACFSLDKMVREYEQLYVSLVKGSSV